VAAAVAAVNADRATLRKYWERTGCLLTADGSLDDRVHLHSGVALGLLPQVKPTAVDADGDNAHQIGLGGGGPYMYMYAGSDGEGKEEKKEEKEGKRWEAVVKVEDLDNVKLDEDEPDLDEEDDADNQLREASLGDVLPAGWQVIEEPPLLDQSLVKSMVAFRWNVTGWGVAKVCRHYARAKGAKGLNYELQYTIGGEIVEHRLRISDYSCSDDAAAGAWCVLRARAPPAAAAAPAAPPASPPA
jgi:hypothetical protein